MVLASAAGTVSFRAIELLEIPQCSMLSTLAGRTR